MTMAWMSRVRLRRDGPLAALGRVLLPEAPDARIGTAHRLLWSLFADGPERRRDFLWREERPGRGGSGRGGFLILSARLPQDPHGLFEIDEPKAWAPTLAPGDRLAFSLRANPVVTRTTGDRRMGEVERHNRHDVVMHAISRLPGRIPDRESARAGRREEKIRTAGLAWLQNQAARNGFALPMEESIRVDGYEQRRVARDGCEPVRFSVLELDGVLAVVEPQRFLAALARGFGKAKAWGCGLMLIRRGGAGP